MKNVIEYLVAIAVVAAGFYAFTGWRSAHAPQRQFDDANAALGPLAKRTEADTPLRPEEIAWFCRTFAGYQIGTRSINPDLRGVRNWIGLAFARATAVPTALGDKLTDKAFATTHDFADCPQDWKAKVKALPPRPVEVPLNPIPPRQAPPPGT